MLLVLPFLPALCARKSGAVVKPNLLCWNWSVLLLGLPATQLPNSDTFPYVSDNSQVWAFRVMGIDIGWNPHDCRKCQPRKNLQPPVSSLKKSSIYIYIYIHIFTLIHIYSLFSPVRLFKGSHVLWVNKGTSWFTVCRTQKNPKLYRYGAYLGVVFGPSVTAGLVLNQTCWKKHSPQNGPNRIVHNINKALHNRIHRQLSAPKDLQVRKMSTVAMVHQLGNWSSRAICVGKGNASRESCAGRNWLVRKIAWWTRLRIVVCWSKPRSIEMPFKSLFNFWILSERRNETGGGNGFAIWEPMIVNDTFFPNA